ILLDGFRRHGTPRGRPRDPQPGERRTREKHSSNSRWSTTGTLDPSVPGRAPNWSVLVTPPVRGASPCAASSDPDDWYPAWGVARRKTVLRGHLNAVVR